MSDQTLAATLPEETAPRCGPDGRDVADGWAGHLEYLSRLSADLGVSDPVEEYFSPVVGRWSDLHAEADRWRLVGDAAQDVTTSLGSPLGGLDAAWDGKAADSFIDYMQKFGLAGQDLSDAMLGIADVLDITGEGIREVVMQLASILGETAESASQAMVMPVQGDDRTRLYLDEMRRPTKELFEAVRQILEAFVRLCEGVDGAKAFEQITMAHTFPENNWTFEAPKPPAVATPDTPAETGKSGAGGVGGGGGGGMGGGAGAAAASGPAAPGGFTSATEQPPAPKQPGGAAPASTTPAGAGGRGMGMMPMAPMMGGMGGQNGAGDHKSRVRVMADPVDVFGKPDKASAPVIGDED
ncbi:WXG100 family type VII secretion target [Actinophytocola xinjiangensis]|uniref:WXG100 family type VII secretion target n=1 Tax=Actinophytocola xinjiangensis TaxID=485602 RepID=UPI000AE505A2|nr:hypothetical protein [Actinophytocola xinjiangensis]